MTFAEKIIDSMVNADGYCGERGISPKQFNILSDYLEPESEWHDTGKSWAGDYKTVYEEYRIWAGTIGKYTVMLQEKFFFNYGYSVVEIGLRDKDEYEAELAENERMRQLRDFSNSQWVAAPKKRLDLDLTFVNDYEYDGYAYSYYDDGVRHVYTFRDEEGNCYVWKTANPLGMWNSKGGWDGVEIGGKVTMKATIKEHSEYKGIKQNVINRPKFISVG